MTQFQDTYLRFKNHASMLAFFRRATVKLMTGDRFDLNEEDDDTLYDIAGSVARLILEPNTVVITEATYDDNGNELTPHITDPNVWVVLRLIGDKAQQNEGSGSRWATSKMSKHIRITGADATDRGARMSRMSFGQGGNSWVEVFNTDDLVALGIVPRVFAGGIR